MIQKKVRIVFSCEETQSAQLKIRLGYDRIRQGSFFNYIIKRYLDNDPLLIQIIEDLKLEEGNTSKRRSKISNSDHSAGRDLMIGLGLTESDKSEIFDLIENDLEDYD